MFLQVCVEETHLFGEDGDVLVEGVRRTDVSSGRAALSWRAGRQFTFFKDECEQWEQRMSAGGRVVEEEDELLQTFLQAEAAQVENSHLQQRKQSSQEVRSSDRFKGFKHFVFLTV